MLCVSQAGDVTQVELLHALAACVRAGAELSIDMLLQLNPDLHTLPIEGEAGLTALHLAARIGSDRVLSALLVHQVHVLDPPCCLDTSAGPSLCLTGLEEASNDVYMYQPLQTYNGHPLYVGHVRGKYIYYYEPQEEDEVRGFAISDSSQLRP